jgi:hypothetical protein
MNCGENVTKTCEARGQREAATLATTTCAIRRTPRYNGFVGTIARATANSRGPLSKEQTMKKGRNRTRKNEPREDTVEVINQGSIEIAPGDEVSINEAAGVGRIQDIVEGGMVVDPDDAIVEPAEELTEADEYDKLAGEVVDEVAGHVEDNSAEDDDLTGPGDEQIAAFEEAMSGHDAQDTIAALRAELEKLQTQGSGRRIKSGSKPRPNVTYTLLNKPPQWSSTPQLAQIEQILFNNQLADGGGFSPTIAEPQLFELLEQGKSRGALRTGQPAVRVFQYYRNRMLKENVLRWE